MLQKETQILEEVAPWNMQNKTKKHFYKHVDVVLMEVEAMENQVSVVSSSSFLGLHFKDKQ